MVKVKTFYNYDSKKLDAEVNEFIADKSVVDIKFNSMPGIPIAYSVMVIYSVDYSEDA